MRAGLLVLLAASCLLSLSGCATHNTLRYGPPAAPKVYSGTRLNAAVLVLSADGPTLDRLAESGVMPPHDPFPLMPVMHAGDREQALLDLVPSALADTLLLPVTVSYALALRWGDSAD